MAESDNESGGQTGNTGGDQFSVTGCREQDRFLPIANVSRIMKKALPANAKISKEAKETVQECVSEFISFITGEASDKCSKEKRKTINGDDLLWAMTTLGFEEYVEPLKIYLHKYREMEGDKIAMMGGGGGGGGGRQQQEGTTTTDQNSNGGDDHQGGVVNISNSGVNYGHAGGVHQSTMMMMMGHHRHHQSTGRMYGSGSGGSSSGRTR